MSLEQLAACSMDTMTLYYSKRSRQNVVSHLRQLSIFCVAFNEVFLPTSRFTLLGFIELMSRSCQYDHIQHVMGSIRFIHKFKNLEFAGDSFEFEILLRGLRRKLARPARQVLPVTPEILELMYPHINVNSPVDLAHWTSFLFALRLLYRKSSIAPESLASFNPITGLSRQKAVITDGVILVYQNFSKTNQFMSANRTTPLISGNILALDPVFHYHKLVSENEVPNYCPAFSYVLNGRVKCVTYRSFTTFLKTLLTKIGLNPDLWSGHPFRRGGASLLYKLGIDPRTIQACGDWSTDTFLRYLEVNFDRLWTAQVAMATYSG